MHSIILKIPPSDMKGILLTEFFVTIGTCQIADGGNNPGRTTLNFIDISIYV
jgi:hypothetical protein